MNPAIRRLAFDLSPWVWAFMLFMYAMGVLTDALWLKQPVAVQAPLIVGFLFNLGTAQSMQKVAFWRTLPVSQRQMDLARWLQGIAFPLLSLTLIMLLPALMMQAQGMLNASWPAIFLMLAAQAGCGTIIFAVFVVSPFLASPTGRVLMRTLLILPIAFAPFWLRNTSSPTLAFSLIAILGLAAALLLYATAGRWPLPITGWAALFSGRQTNTAPGKPGLCGWPALLLAQMPIVLLCWGAMLALPLATRWILGLRNMDESIIIDLALLGGGLLTATSFATAMRVLRALPLTGVSLTARIVGTLIALQLAGAVLYVAILTGFEPDHPPLAGLALLPVALPVLVFALSLRFGPLVGQFGVAFSIMVTNVGALLLWQFGAGPAQIAAVVALATVLGALMAYREIICGRHAYRAQPLIPLSWRGR